MLEEEKGIPCKPQWQRRIAKIPDTLAKWPKLHAFLEFAVIKF